MVQVFALRATGLAKDAYITVCADQVVEAHTLSPERISDRQRLLDNLAVLQVLSVERRAAGFERRGDNERVVHRKSVALGDPQAVLVGLQRERRYRTHGDDRAERFPYLRNRHSELAHRHRREFIQHLNADDRIRGHGAFDPVGFRRVGGEQVEKNVRIEKTLSHARSLPDGRSESRRADDPGTSSVAQVFPAPRVS